MNHNAIDLFPGWYSKGVNRDVFPDELNIRRTAISEILKITDVAIWINILKVYLNIFKFGSEEYEKVVSFAKLGDENFSIQNENIVRLMCGCAIAQKIDINDGWIADFLFMALVTSKIIPSAVSPIFDLRNRASDAWIKEAETSRSMSFKLNPGKKNLKSTPIITVSKITTDQSTPPIHSEETVKAIASLQTDLNLAINEINKLNVTLEIISQNFLAVSEETNILWWLFGGYSMTLNKPFNRLSPDLLCIIISFELKNITESIPGVGGIESVIQRALSTVEYEIGSQYSIEHLTSSILNEEEKIKQLLPKDYPELHVFTPLLYAIKCRTEFSGTEWETIYNKTIKLDLDTKIEYSHYSTQLYKELMIINVFEKIKN